MSLGREQLRGQRGKGCVWAWERAAVWHCRAEMGQGAGWRLGAGPSAEPGSECHALGPRRSKEAAPELLRALRHSHKQGKKGGEQKGEGRKKRL